MRFVTSIAYQYRGRSIPLTDLISLGAAGLINAANRYDEHKKTKEGKAYKFITYAVWWIKNSIEAELRDRGNLIRIPANQRSRIVKALKEERKNKTPVADEIRRLLRLQRPVSFEASVDARGTLLGNTFGRHHRPYQETDEVLQSVLETLSTREKQAVEMRFGVGNYYYRDRMKFREIGEEMGLSKQRAQQLVDKGIRKLKKQHNYLPALRASLEERMAYRSDADNTCFSFPQTDYL